MNESSELKKMREHLFQEDGLNFHPGWMKMSSEFFVSKDFKMCFGIFIFADGMVFFDHVFPSVRDFAESRERAFTESRLDENAICLVFKITPQSRYIRTKDGIDEYGKRMIDEDDAISVQQFNENWRDIIEKKGVKILLIPVEMPTRFITNNYHIIFNEDVIALFDANTGSLMSMYKIGDYLENNFDKEE